MRAGIPVLGSWHWLWALLLVGMLIFLELNRQRPAFRLSSFPNQSFGGSSFKTRLAWLPRFLRFLAAVALVLALARPQLGHKSVEIVRHGVDIFLAMDTSGSMLAHDFVLHGGAVDRLTAIQAVARDFVRGRVDDRIGIVVFGSVAFTQGPLTLDHEMVVRQLDDLQIGMAGRETALGDALGTAVARMKDLESESKVIILLTDGTNTAGDMDPEQAAEIAALHKIKVHCIGIGRKGTAKIPQQTAYGVAWIDTPSDLDEPTLKRIAAVTGGEYFRAEDLDALKNVYARIDAMETSKAVTKTHENRDEYFVYPLALAMLAWFLAELLTFTWLRRFPA